MSFARSFTYQYTFNAEVLFIKQFVLQARPEAKAPTPRFRGEHGRQNGICEISIFLNVLGPSQKKERSKRHFDPRPRFGKPPSPLTPGISSFEP